MDKKDKQEYEDMKKHLVEVLMISGDDVDTVIRSWERFKAGEDWEVGA